MKDEQLLKEYYYDHVDPDRLQDLYKMNLRFAYGDVGRLIREMNEAILIYKESTEADSDSCKKRIAYYQSIIDLAKATDSSQ